MEITKYPVAEKIAKFMAINELIKEKNFEQAEKLAAEWRNEEFDNSEAWRVSSLVYSKTGNTAKALTCIDFALQYCPSNDTRPLLSKAKILMDNNEYDKANQVYDEMMEKFRESNLSYYATALIMKADISQKTNPETTVFHLEHLDKFFKKHNVEVGAYYQDKLEEIKESTQKKSSLKI